MTERLADTPAGTVGFRAAGEARVFALDQIDAAKAWVAAA